MARLVFVSVVRLLALVHIASVIALLALIHLASTASRPQMPPSNSHHAPLYYGNRHTTGPQDDVFANSGAHSFDFLCHDTPPLRHCRSSTTGSLSLPESQIKTKKDRIRTVKVSNVSLKASERDIKEFFSFSGDIEHVDIKSGDERSQIPYVTFKDPQGAETAVLLSGATIVDQNVTIALAPDYKISPAASLPMAATESKSASGAESTVQKAEDIIATMLAKGFILGKDAVNKAKAFDERHQFTSTAAAKVASLNRKIGFSEKISVGTTIVNDKVKEMDQKFQVFEKTKSAFSAAAQTVSSAGSAIMKNRYVLTGASWVTGAFNGVAKAAGEMGQKTKDKVLAEEQSRKSEGYHKVPES